MHCLQKHGQLTGSYTTEENVRHSYLYLLPLLIAPWRAGWGGVCLMSPSSTWVVVVIELTSCNISLRRKLGQAE